MANEDVLERAKRELARLEDALAATAARTAAAPAPAVEEPVPDTTDVLTEEPTATPQVEPSTGVPARAITPSYLAAHALRAAFLYEQTTAFEQASSIEPDDEPEVVVAPAPPVVVAEPAHSVPPPEPKLPDAQDEGSPSVLRLWLGHASRTNWLAALCLLSLIVMVVVLTGHAPRRLTGGKTS